MLAATGLTVEEFQKAASLEHRRLWSAGLLLGMDRAERLSRIMKIMPPDGTPWAPPGRCAVLWLILFEALKNGHHAAGVELFHERTEAGSVKSLGLRWHSRLRGNWTAGIPSPHLDATLRQELVEPYLRFMDIQPPVTARQPHVRVRLITDSPTSAKALKPLEDAPERDHRAAAGHLRDIAAWVALRALQHRQGHAAPSVLVIGQKATIGALRSMGLPPDVDAVHFNGLSGLDHWGDVRCLIVLGRTLPAPLSLERTAMALTGRMPITNPADAGWWFPPAEKHLRLAGGRTMPLMTKTHADPIDEAIRWSICERELIQAFGRGRGVNRTPETPLDIDLLTDAALPLTIHEVITWSDLKPQRCDLMALQGVVLENAADIATCFPTLWPYADSARQDRQRSVTFCYYKDLNNSRMSHSSADVSYQLGGARQRMRIAPFDLSTIPDPRNRLLQRLLTRARVTGCIATT